MEWIALTTIEQLDIIDRESEDGAVLIFKHSTRCNISGATLERVQRKWEPDSGNQLKPYFLDLLSHRDISKAIAERYGVAHQSPQALIIRNAKCVFSQTHMEINYTDMMSAATE